MPGRDFTGPLGRGAMSGRGLGPCGGGQRYCGWPRGYRYLRHPYLDYPGEPDKAELEDEKKALQARLTEIEKQLATKV